MPRYRKIGGGGIIGPGGGAVNSERRIDTDAPLQGGGSLAADRTLSIDTATLLVGVGKLAERNVWTGANYFTGLISTISGQIEAGNLSTSGTLTVGGNLSVAGNVTVAGTEQMSSGGSTRTISAYSTTVNVAGGSVVVSGITGGGGWCEEIVAANQATISGCNGWNLGTPAQPTLWGAMLSTASGARSTVNDVLAGPVRLASGAPVQLTASGGAGNFTGTIHITAWMIEVSG